MRRVGGYSSQLQTRSGIAWYLWVIRSASAIVFVMAPGRGAKVPLRYFSKLLVQTVLVCDRYAAYKKVARIMGLLLAFCRAHVRQRLSHPGAQLSGYRSLGDGLGAAHRHAVII